MGGTVSSNYGHSDFIIKVSHHKYKVHRSVLSIRSPYFKAMLKDHTKESQEGKAEMKQVDFECVKSCLQFMYTDKLHIPDGKIIDLLHVASIMQLADAEKKICEILCCSVTAKNFFGIRRLAEMFSLVGLREKCDLYLKENFMAISSQVEFVTEEMLNVAEAFTSSAFALTEHEKLTACLRWVDKDPEKMNDLIRLIGLIDLTVVPLKYLNELLTNHPMVRDWSQVRKMISDVAADIAFQLRQTDNNNIILFDEFSQCLRCYDTSSGEVAKCHNERVEFVGPFTAVSVDCYIYVLCHDRPVYRLYFRDRNSKWEKMKDMIACHGPTPPVVSLLGLLYVIGYSKSRRSDHRPMKYVEMYDPDINRWCRLKDAPRAMCNTTLVALGDSIYCLGGRNGRDETQAFCKFTPSTSKWDNLTQMPLLRTSFCAVAANQCIFVMAGMVHDGSITEMECYDVTSANWTFMTPMIEIHYFAFASVINGCIFLFPSRGLSQDEHVVTYDIAKDLWFRSEVNTDVPMSALPSLLSCVSVRF